MRYMYMRISPASLYLMVTSLEPTLGSSAHPQSMLTAGPSRALWNFWRPMNFDMTLQYQLDVIELKKRRVCLPSMDIQLTVSKQGSRWQAWESGSNCCQGKGLLHDLHGEVPA